MRTVTVNFIGGKPFTRRMPDDAARKLTKALAEDPRGTTEISGDDGIFCVIHRQQITFVEISE